MTMKSSVRVTLHAALSALLLLAFVSPASAIPAFARKYALRCTACHESWPVLNDFGRAFRDNGYQLRLGKDDTVTADPGYWPVAVRITPQYAYTRISNEATDQGGQTLSSGGIADAGIDLLMAGNLTKDISFLVVPTGFASDGAVNLESYWAYFSRLVKNSDWVNLRVGQFELDLPSSAHRPMSLTSGYLMYGYHPMTPGGPGIAAFDMGQNQRGVELSGHDESSLRRYALTVFSAMDSLGSHNAISSPSYYAHVQQYFRFDSGNVSQAEIGAWGALAHYPTTALSENGEPIPGTGGNLQESSRYGVEGNLWLGSQAAPLHLTAVYGGGTDKQALFSGADRDGSWNGGYVEAVWVPPTDGLHWGLFGRYDMVRNNKQPDSTAASSFNDQDQLTLGARYTIAYTVRDEVAVHAEVSSLNMKGVGFQGLDERVDTIMLGVDFAY